jgi:hypothetical protein
MDKYIFCLEDNLKTMTREQFRDFILHEVAPSIMKHGPANCKVTISAVKQPTITILPLKRNGFAMFSVTGVDRDALFNELGSILNPGRLLYGYAVHESPYLLSARSWSHGSESPGLILLTMFRKKKNLPRETFMRIWFGEHSPMSIVIHPLGDYIRNVVTGYLTEDTPGVDGIVEEHFGSDRDLLNPVRMFGGIRKVLPSMLRIQRHVSGFIDLSNIKNYICREYLIKGELAACNREMRDDDIVPSEPIGVIQR